MEHASTSNPEPSLSDQNSYRIDGQRLKLVRGNRNQQDLAGFAKYDKSSYSKLETGKISKISGQVVKAFATFLDVHPASLLNRSTPEYGAWVRSFDDSILGQPFPIKHQIPSPTQVSDVQKIQQLINDKHQRISLISAPGSGKSVVLLSLMREYPKHEVCYINIDSRSTAHEVWSSLKRQLYPETSHEFDRFEIVIWLNRICTVLIVDTSSYSSRLRSLLDFLSLHLTAPMVFGAASPLGLDGELTISLSQLSDGAGYPHQIEDITATDAWHILSVSLTDTRKMQLLDSKHRIVLQRLMQLCQGHAQAYQWIGKRLENGEPEDIYTEFSHSFTSPKSDIFKSIAINRVLHFSQQTSAYEQQVYKILPYQFNAAELAGLLGLTSDQIEHDLEVATTAGLLRPFEVGYRVDESIQQIAQDSECLHPPLPIEDFLKHLTKLLDGLTVEESIAVVSRYANPIIAACLSPEIRPSVIESYTSLLLNTFFHAAAHRATWPTVLRFVQSIIPKLPLEHNAYSIAARYAASACIFMGEFDSAEYWADLCVDHAKNLTQEASGYNLKGSTPLARPNPSPSSCRAALQDFNTGIELYREIDDRISVATLLFNRMYCQEALGDLESALATLQESTAIIDDLKHDHLWETLQCERLINEVRVYSRCGEWEMIGKAIKALQTINRKKDIPTTRFLHATLASTSIALDQTPSCQIWIDAKDTGSLCHPSNETVLLAHISRMRFLLDGVEPQHLEEQILKWIEVNAKIVVQGDRIDLRNETALESVLKRVEQRIKS